MTDHWLAKISPERRRVLAVGAGGGAAGGGSVAGAGAGVHDGSDAADSTAAITAPTRGGVL